jgi:NarL family two-component system response regulator LiaR
MSESAPIRVFVADDHAIVRKGIAAVLEIVPDIEVVGEAENGRDTVRQVEALQPDVILMDLVMPKMDGIEAIRRIKERQPGARILVLTTFAGEDQILPAIKAGALGYHLKDSRPQELAQAIRQVHRGESSLHPVIARKVLEELSRPSDRPPTPDPLTPREVEVLQLVAQGLENWEIAEKLVITEATVRTHVSNITAKLHVASRTQAALYALREGIASLDE